VTSGISPLLAGLAPAQTVGTNKGNLRNGT